MALPLKPKQSGETEDFDVDFSKYLPEDDTITTVELSLDITGELELHQYQNQSPIIKVWTRGGVNTTTYKVTVKVGTAQGRVKEQEFRVRIKDS